MDSGSPAFQQRPKRSAVIIAYTSAFLQVYFLKHLKGRPVHVQA